MPPSVDAGRAPRGSRPRARRPTWSSPPRGSRRATRMSLRDRSTPTRSTPFPPRVLDEVGEPREFLLRQFRGGVAEVGRDCLFERAVEERLQDAPERAPPRAAARPARAIDERQAVL